MNRAICKLKISGALGAGAIALSCLWPRPAHAAPQPSTESQQVMAAIEKTLQRHAGDVHACFGQALADRLDIAGKLELEITVGAGRTVKDVRVAAKDDTVSEGLATCVASAAKSWQVDGIEAGASVVLPFNFSGQANQFVVSAQDAPLRGPQTKNKRAAPFAVKILIDAENVRSRNLSVTHLVITPANRVAMHRHPQSAKVLYILKGNARVLGPSGQDPIKLSEGDAVYIPKGFPHVIENMGRQISAEMLQVFSPAGPQKVYRDPADAAGRAAFEVLRGQEAKAPDGAKLVVTRGNAKTAVVVGKASTKMLVDPAATGDPSIVLNVIQYQPGAAVPKHTNIVSEEFLWLISGGGALTVGAESIPIAAGDAVFIPSAQPAAFAFKKEEATEAVQIFSPAPPPVPQATP